MAIDWAKVAAEPDAGPPPKGSKRPTDWAAVASGQGASTGKPPPRKPIMDREGEAFSTLGKDMVPSLDKIVQATAPGGPERLAGQDAVDLTGPITALGGGLVEHGERALERVSGAHPSQINLPPWLQGALDVMPGAVGGTIRGWNAFAGMSPEARAKGAGDVGAALTPIPGVEGVGAISDLAKATRLAREAKVPLSVARAMLKAGHVTEAPVKQPGVVQRVGHVVREAGRKMGGEPAEVVSPETREAGKRMGQGLVQRLVAKRDPTGEKLRANPMEAAGKPITAAEALGGEAQTHLAMAGRRSGQTPDSLLGNLLERHFGMPERLRDDFARSTGLNPAEAEADFATANEERRKALQPLYDDAYAIGSLDSDTLRQLSARPSMEAAIKRAYKLAREEGANPEEIGIVIGTKTEVRRGADGELHRVPLNEPYFEVRHPTMRTWDFIKRALDDTISDYKDPRTGRLSGEGRSANNTRRELRDELFKLNPKYEKAVGEAGDQLSQEEVFGKSGKLFGQGTSDFQFSQAVKKMSAADKRALLSGAMRDLWGKLQSSNVGINRLLAPSYKAKFAQLIGNEKAEALFKRVQMERDLAKTGGRMMPGVNSVTSDMLFADQEIKEGANNIKRFSMPIIRKRGWRGLAQAIAEVSFSPLEGAYHGLKAPLEESARDEVGLLLQMTPSELGAFVEKLRVDPPTAKKIWTEFNKIQARKLAIVAAGAKLGQQQQQQPQPAAP